MSFFIFAYVLSKRHEQPCVGLYVKDIYTANSFGRQRYCPPLEDRADFFPDQDNKDNMLLWGKGVSDLLVSP